MDQTKNVNQTAENKDRDHLVRVLSPGMLVAKRFFRNRLAIVGLVVLIAMFVFAFIGGAIIPYSESEVFFTKEMMRKDYAGATYMNDYRIYTDEGTELPSDIYTKIIRVTASGDPLFEAKDGNKYALIKYTENSYGLCILESVKNIVALKSPEYTAAQKAGESSFVFEDVTYYFEGKGKIADLFEAKEIGVVCQLTFTPYDAATVLSLEFYQQILLAMADGSETMEADGTEYQLEIIDEGTVNVRTSDGAEYAYVSNMNINSVVSGVTLTPEYKMLVKEAINAGEKSFEYTDADGNTETYDIENKNGQYTIKRYQETAVIDIYATPSAKHPMGTDANGMDILARLMYGGRVSLMIGFVVVFIELIIGVIVGGVAGYFGGWVDTLLMRVVDIVYCIPAMPLYLILGSVMDYYEVSSTTRIYLLCVIMAVIGWVGIARIVRGQILSLREQEFMIAAEATGISIKRRIFKHLVPNVIPQLIVFATMGLGDVILVEASLSFLGLGVKYPAATWGSIINAVNDSYVMTNYLFVWVPAGLLILLTVLAFNFVGDGLRDAFDPKMKR